MITFNNGAEWQRLAVADACVSLVFLCDNGSLLSAIYYHTHTHHVTPPTDHVTSVYIM